MSPDLWTPQDDDCEEGDQDVSPATVQTRRHDNGGQRRQRDNPTEGRGSGSEPLPALDDREQRRRPGSIDDALGDESQEIDPDTADGQPAHGNGH